MSELLTYAALAERLKCSSEAARALAKRCAYRGSSAMTARRLLSSTSLRSTTGPRQLGGGLANGFLARNNLATTTGVRFPF
jgi:hypothetical protein